MRSASAIGAPTAVVFVAAAVVASAGAMVRPVQSALLPSLAKLPEELVAGNVVSSLGEAVGTFVGPLLGGILVASVSEQAAMGVAAIFFAAATSPSRASTRPRTAARSIARTRRRSSVRRSSAASGRWPRDRDRHSSSSIS